MSQIVDLENYPRGRYPLDIYKFNSNNFDFVIGDFKELSYPNVEFIAPYYEQYVSKIDNYGQSTEVLEAFPYIDIPRNYLFNEFSAVTELNVNYKGFTKENLFILDNKKYEIKIYSEAPNIAKYFNQEQINEFYILKEYDYYKSYSLPFTTYPDYVSPIALHTQIIPDYMERIFFNIDVHYGRNHSNFKKIVEYMEHFLNWEYNKRFFTFINKFSLNVDKLNFYKGIQYLESEVIDYLGKVHRPYIEGDIFLFDFKEIFSHSIEIKKEDFNLLFELLNINSSNANSYLIGGLGQRQYHLSKYLKENYKNFQFPLFSSTLVIQDYFAYFFYTQNHIYNGIYVNEREEEQIKIKSSDMITIHIAFLKGVEESEKFKKFYGALELLGNKVKKKYKCCLLDCLKNKG
ncbi:hypothetical protein AFAEC_1108 [Aliarcobacter faecis]|uniref:hypothetical protein n=2 Tax=Aliarcobacter faecis TaxID=1564138 RepID=UPI0004793DEF|nr:hypothetical protein [Aliarcobacter faecis]QKF73274.1 hypothetical protein AFAEC_1108 [Aliarcobacter faecis]